jgi:hypothetical protein
MAEVSITSRSVEFRDRDAGKGYTLIGLAVVNGEGAWPGRGQVEVFNRFVQGEAHVISAQASLTFQQAGNQPDASAPAIAAKGLWERGAERRPWIKWLNKPQHRDPCGMTLVGHTNRVKACCYSPDEKRIIPACLHCHRPVRFNPFIVDNRHTE